MRIYVAAARKKPSAISLALGMAQSTHEKIHMVILGMVLIGPTAVIRQMINDIINNQILGQLFFRQIQMSVYGVYMMCTQNAHNMHICLHIDL